MIHRLSVPALRNRRSHRGGGDIRRARCEHQPRRRRGFDVVGVSPKQRLGCTLGDAAFCHSRAQATASQGMRACARGGTLLAARPWQDRPTRNAAWHDPAGRGLPHARGATRPCGRRTPWPSRGRSSRRRALTRRPRRQGASGPPCGGGGGSADRNAGVVAAMSGASGEADSTGAGGGAPSPACPPDSNKFLEATARRGGRRACASNSSAALIGAHARTLARAHRHLCTHTRTDAPGAQVQEGLTSRSGADSATEALVQGNACGFHPAAPRRPLAAAPKATSRRTPTRRYVTHLTGPCSASDGVGHGQSVKCRLRALLAARSWHRLCRESLRGSNEGSGWFHGGGGGGAGVSGSRGPSGR